MSGCGCVATLVEEFSLFLPLLPGFSTQLQREAAHAITLQKGSCKTCGECHIQSGVWGLKHAAVGLLFCAPGHISMQPTCLVLLRRYPMLCRYLRGLRCFLSTWHNVCAQKLQQNRNRTCAVVLPYTTHFNVLTDKGFPDVTEGSDFACEALWILVLPHSEVEDRRS